MNFDNYLEMRLNQWAEWFSRDNQYLSYPSCSIEYRLMKNGIIVPSTAPKQIPCNEEAEEIEALVKEMAEYNNEMALALRLRYFEKGMVKKRHAALNVSYSQFRFYISMARQWLAGRLSLLYKIKMENKKIFQKTIDE